MKSKILSLVVLLLAGCDMPRETTQMTPAVEAVSERRFTVEQVEVFRDQLAYGNRRGIYLITDRQTGKVYVGVSGIGISELGSHVSGKATVSDER